MCRRGDQFLMAYLREALLHLGPIELWVLNAASLAPSTADQHCAHTLGAIARCTPPTFGGLIIRVGMNSEQATRARGWFAMHAQQLGLWDGVVSSCVSDGRVYAVQQSFSLPECSLTAPYSTGLQSRYDAVGDARNHSTLCSSST